jgi:hypothetical protein
MMRKRLVMRGEGSMGLRIGRRVGRGSHCGSFRLATAVVLCGLISSAGISPVGAVEPGRASEDLLRLVPPDATVVATVEGLRDQMRTLAGSELASNLRRLPAVRAWIQSEHYRNLERSCAEIEAALGVKLAELRDELIGDAVVLVLRLDPDGRLDPRQARGLLLLRARDPGLLERLIARVNSSQRESRELDRVTDCARAATTYHVREFPAGGGRPPEWYVTYPDGTFAFSNSEALIQGVIDRKAQAADGKTGANEGAAGGSRGGATATVGPGLCDISKFKAVHRRLPERALARLFVDPRAIERLLAAVPRSNKASDVRIIPMLERYLAAVDYGGAALTWGADAIVVHAVESLDPSRLDPGLRRWAGDSRARNPAVRSVPPTAVALASAHIDALALREAVFQLVPADSQQRVHNLESVASGLLLGQDLRTRILPALGPSLIAYLDSPLEPQTKVAGPDPPAGRAALFPVVVVIGLSQDPAVPRPDGRLSDSGPTTVTLAAALENALRTLLALTALDETRGEGRSRIVTREVAGATVTTLDVPLPFAYAVDRAQGRLVLGSSDIAVARYLESSSDPEAGRRFRELQAVAFADAETFLCIDLDTLTRLADRYRDRLAKNFAARQKRPAADVERDLDHVLALARLFRAAFIASRMESDATAVHRSIGVILHREDSPSHPQP